MSLDIIYSMKKNIAALIYGNNKHYIDHLAPICYFLNIPLLTNEEEIFLLIKKYYPNVNAALVDNREVNFYLVKNFDKIISCITKDLFDLDFRFQQDVLNKEIEIIWCPHGNSDKGKTLFFMEALKNASVALVYGNKMKDFLKEKKVFHTIGSIIEIGNYRYLYFEKNKKFYDQIIKNKIFSHLDRFNKNILYAPTWKDSENSSSFFCYTEKLINSLPKKYNLIIKLHPNTILKNELKIELLKEMHQNKKVLFLNNFTPIYPLLNITDIYIGDFSSISYDFLKFDRPMFFLKGENQKLKSDMFECGHIIEEENIFEQIENNLKKQIFLKEKKELLYNYTFGCKAIQSNLNKVLNL